MLVIPAMIGGILEMEAQLKAEPTLDQLRRAVEPHLGGQQLEHVTVLYEGQRRDMFVGENSATTGIFNMRATEIYWNAARSAIAADYRLAANYPEPWPVISGPAVLFPDRQVWF